MTTESKEQIAREAATDFIINGWQIDASLRELAIETLTKQILSVIEQVHQDGWYEGRDYEAKFGVKPGQIELQRSEQRLVIDHEAKQRWEEGIE